MFCKPPHPVYIVLFRGDDTDFVGNQEIIVKITTERNISGCKAYFKYMGNIQTFDEIPENKELHLVFSHEQTKEMPLGTWDAELYLIDGNGKRMTVNNRIHMLVTNSVREAYFPDDPQAVSVVISANKYVEDAEVSADGKTLTLTKKDGTEVSFSGGGGGGTNDYNDLENKPSINGATLTGNVELATPEQLELKADKADLEGFATEADLLAFYYPGGGVTSMGQITASGIEYAVGEDGGAYVVRGTEVPGHVVLPWKVTIGGEEYKVTAIGGGAFEGNNLFNSFTAPITVKSIEGYAFTSCGSLASVDLPSATSIYNGAFSSCGSLASVNLPSATSIYSGAFSSCGSLASVNLPSAASIGEYAFNSCGSLASVDLPSATSFGYGAFYSCGSLATVDFGSSPKSLVPVLDTYGSFVDVPPSCKFIIPIGMYDEWTSAPVWRDLYEAGYKFEGYASTEQIENKADKATTLAGYGITDGATKTELAELTAKVEYPLYAVPPTGVLKDRTINTTSLASVTIPDNFTDLLIRASVASSLAVTIPEAITTKYGDTFPGDAGEYLITITKTGASEAYVRTIKLEVANA